MRIVKIRLGKSFKNHVGSYKHLISGGKMNNFCKDCSYIEGQWCCLYSAPQKDIAAYKRCDWLEEYKRGRLKEAVTKYKTR